MRRIAWPPDRVRACSRSSLAFAAGAQALEKPKLTIGVGGKPLFYYLPLTIAERNGYFKAEGLDVEILDFPGGARALQALLGGSVDVVSGAYEHTITQQAKGQNIEALVLQGKYAGIVLGMTKAKAAAYKSPADLKGMKIGVTAPGSSTNMFVNILLAKAGLKPDAVAIIGVGAAAGAVAIMKRGEIDAISNLDPVISQLESDGTIVPVIDTRTAKGMQDVYGGAYAAGCIYVPVDFAKKYPNTAQAVVNAMVRALRFIQTSTPDQIVAAVPPEYYTDKALYKAALEKNIDDVQARRLHQRSTAGAERLPRPQDASIPTCRRRRRRPREDDQHDVPAEGRAEVQVSACRAATPAGTLRSRSSASRARSPARGGGEPLHRGRRHVARRRAGRVRVGRRADRLRQVDAAQRRGRPARAVVGRVLVARRAARRASTARRLHVPGRRADAVAQRARNVTAGLEFRGAPRAEAAADARANGSRASGLAGFEDRYPHQLSGGMRKRVALAQMLILDPEILLMDEPFSALDIQTRQLMENELLELWSANRKSVLFITHDLEEAIALSDRVIVLSAGPATHPIGEFAIDLPRPRDVAEIRMTPRFVELHEAIWQRAEGRSAEGLCAKPAREPRLSRGTPVRSIRCCCSARCSRSGT